MRGLKMGLLAVATAVVVFVMAGYPGGARSAGQPQASGAANPGTNSSQQEYIEWPLPETDRAYGAIDGKHLHEYVDQQVEISHRYRDQGHQFWGRIIGTSGDAESAQWLVDKFKQIGMADTHIQPIDLGPQWMPQSWEVSATGGGKTLQLTSAQPAYASTGTEGGGLDLEAVYLDFGSEADFAGRDVRGKAVFISRYRANHRGTLRRTAPEPGALRRAEEKGAAAIFDVNEMPGNLKFQSYPTNTKVPTFSVGTKDGHAIRDLIDQAGAGQAPHVHVRMDVQMVPNLKTALVWGTLPGATDETIYIIAHRDGWFDAAGDNAGGVASMLGLAEYFAKVPKNQRRRTIVFIGWDGHHNSGPSGSAGTTWLYDHRDQFFGKTALMFDDEHPSDVETYFTAGETAGQTDATVPLEWYAGGPSRPALGKIATDAFREFGVVIWDKPSPAPPAGDLGRFYKMVPGVDAQSNDFFYFHTDANTPETVPWTGLQAVTRAYAKIIDQVNKLDLKELQRPPEPDARPSGTAGGNQ